MFDLLGQVDWGKDGELVNLPQILTVHTGEKTVIWLMDAVVNILYIISQICPEIKLF